VEVDEDPFAYIILNVDVEIRKMVGVWEIRIYQIHSMRSYDLLILVSDSIACPLPEKKYGESYDKV